MVLLLLYALAINIENNAGSQRYTVEAVMEDGSHSKFECLSMLDGVTKEMALEKSGQTSQITRQKMDIFTKWLTC